MPETTYDPVSMIKPRRKITGISAVLLPYLESGEIDRDSLSTHVAQTAEVGITPAVNMEQAISGRLERHPAKRIALLSYVYRKVI